MSRISFRALRVLVEAFVLNEVRLGIYNPSNPRRSHIPTSGFVAEFLEIDESGELVHCAGPVTLATDNGPLTQHLRISIPIHWNGRVAEIQTAGMIATYVVETDPDTGACKETAALANV